VITRAVALARGLLHEPNVGLVFLVDALGGLTALAVAVRLVAGAVQPLGDFLDGLNCLSPWWLVAVVLPVALLWLGAGRRHAAAVLVALFVVLLGLEDDWTLRAHADHPADTPSLSVLALNVRHYWAGHLRVVEAMKSLDPDLVLISENHVDTNAVQELRADLAPYTFLSGRSDEAAIASRLPILEATEVDLPSRAPTLHHPNRIEDQSTHPHRSFMHARVDFHGTPVNAISVRFIAGIAASSAIGDEVAWGRYVIETQEEEVRFFLDYLSHVQGPIVFGGDLNAPPTAHVIRLLDAVATDAYMSDHWIGLPTFPVKFPFLRLDYIFCMNGLVPMQALRPDVRVSDHYPVLARLELAPGRTTQSSASSAPSDGPA
jgi:endonuclease/exonuclease/phosphatase (EEP) superfamily protein YafD